MRCNHCGENLSVFEMLKEWLWFKMPNPIRERADRLVDENEVRIIKTHYSSQLNLTPREQIVCELRSGGLSTETIANSMNVTRERVRQIQAKVVRKIRREV